MKKLNPTLWRTCRVLSNETRLRLLWRLFNEKEMSVGKLARSAGVSESSASTHLRAMNARGLTSVERRRLYVYYAAVANPDIEHAVALLGALRVCHERADSVVWIMKQASAFTHVRRISIVKVLSEGAMELIALSIKTQIPLQSLHRHLRKLEARGFVDKQDGVLHIKSSEHPLPAALLHAALN